MCVICLPLKINNIDPVVHFHSFTYNLFIHTYIHVYLKRIHKYRRIEYVEGEAIASSKSKLNELEQINCVYLFTII